MRAASEGTGYPVRAMDIGAFSSRLLPMAYLVAPHETNNAATYHWAFTPSGLERLASRAGWKVLERLNVGDTEGSDPATAEGDERMFLLPRRGG